MYDAREEFDYFVCSSCNCMQIVKVPEGLGDYYSNNYYSLAEREIPEFHGEADVENRVLDVRDAAAGNCCLSGQEKDAEIYTGAILLLRRTYVMGTEYTSKM